MSELQRGPGRPKNEIPSAVKSNFVDFTGLRKEYATGKMDERRRVALRKKLLTCLRDKSIMENEKDLLVSILKRERVKGTINYVDEYDLNEIEEKDCADNCFVKTDDAPTVQHLKKGLVCKFKQYENDKGEIRYAVYVWRTLEPREQLDSSTALKLAYGHPTTEKDFPPHRKLLHRFSYTQKEFSAWFEIMEDILEGGSKFNPSTIEDTIIL